MRANHLALLFLGACLLGTFPGVVVAEGQRPEILKWDLSAFPAVRAYVQVPDASFATAKARLEFKEKPDAATWRAWDAIKALREQYDAATAEARRELTAPPELPARPPEATDATLKTYADQADESEGVLVVFLVDTSRSMANQPDKGHEPLAEVQRDALAILGALKPVDRVALVRFDQEPSLELPPTTDRGAARSAIANLAAVGDSTRIYDALEVAVNKILGKQESPTLPGRRFLFVFSDGKDEGSAFKPEDFAALFHKGEARTPVVFSVGVGRESKKSDQFDDLKRVAGFAGSQERFLESPASSGLVAAFEREVTGLERQVLLEAHLPAYYWRAGDVRVVTELKTERGAIAGEHAIPVTLSDEQKQQAAAYRAALEGLPTWLAEQDGKRASEKQFRTWLFAGIGAGVLLLLLVALLVSKGRKKKAKEEEQRQKEEDDKAEILAKIEREKEEREKQARLEEARRRVPIALLVAIDGPMRGSRFGIMGNTCTIGREATCDMVLPDKERGGDGSISRVHAQLAYDGQAWTLVSLADNNILRVGQTQLRKGDPRYPIHLGDRLVMGATTFELLKP